MAKKKILCPYCYRHFFNVDVEYRCENNEKDANMNPFCPPSLDKKFNDHWKSMEVSNHFFKGRRSLFSSTPGPAKCDVCGMESTTFVCPHCHNKIPSEMVENGAEIISIIGAPNSGKTVYFTALMQQLMNYGVKLHLGITPIDAEDSLSWRKTSVVVKERHKTLFKEKTLLEKTSELGDGEKSVPLIFKIHYKDVYARNPEKTEKFIYLVFYDTAGEMFEEKERMNIVRYLEESSGVILLLDPFTIDSMREKIDTVIDAGDQERATGEQFVLERLVDFVTDKSKLQNKPLAIAFSKIDAFIRGYRNTVGRDIPGIDLAQNSSFVRTGKLSLAHVDSIDSHLTMALDEHCDGLGSRVGEYARITFGKDNVRLFAVSSLGCNPNEDGTLDEVKPYRVMDPLVWMLYKMGFQIPLE